MIDIIIQAVVISVILIVMSSLINTIRTAYYSRQYVKYMKQRMGLYEVRNAPTEEVTGTKTDGSTLH